MELLVELLESYAGRLSDRAFPVADLRAFVDNALALCLVTVLGTRGAGIRKNGRISLD